MRALALLLLLAACDKAPPPPPHAVAPGAPSAPAPAPQPLEDPDACLTRVLQQAGLNEYGDPPGTMYAGGTPLFNERTGRVLTRREYVRARHPELVERCPIP